MGRGIKFKDLFAESKFLSEVSAQCGFCRQMLKIHSIQENEYHIYNVGLLYTCQCGKSRIWTNSIRNLDRFLDFLDGKPDRYRGENRYTNGFCNDLYCGYLSEHKRGGIVYVLQNGAELPGDPQRYDRYGCNLHEANQQIFVDRFKFHPENDESTKKLIEIFRPYRNELEKFR